MTWLLDLILGPVGAALGGLVTLAAVFFAGKSNQKKADKIDKLESEVKAHDTRNEVENRIARERDARERLRDDWRE